MIDEADRREMLRVDLCGNRVVERLEAIGVTRLSDLRGQDAEELVERVNLAAGAPITSEPRQGGITELRIAFDMAPGAPGASPVTLEEDASCPSPPTYTPYTGSSVVGASVAGNELVLTVAPALENARTYRITLGTEVSSIAGQTLEIRGLLGDVDSSGSVNAVDRSMIVGVWTSPSHYSPATDLDRSGATNAVDRSMAVGAWTGTQTCAP